MDLEEFLDSIRITRDSIRQKILDGTIIEFDEKDFKEFMGYFQQMQTLLDRHEFPVLSIGVDLILKTGNFISNRSISYGYGMQQLLEIYCLQDDALQSTLIGEEIPPDILDAFQAIEKTILPDFKTNDRPELAQQQNEFLTGIREKLLDKISKETYQRF